MFIGVHSWFKVFAFYIATPEEKDSGGRGRGKGGDRGGGRGRGGGIGGGRGDGSAPQIQGSRNQRSYYRIFTSDNPLVPRDKAEEAEESEEALQVRV